MPRERRGRRGGAWQDRHINIALIMIMIIIMIMKRTQQRRVRGAAVGVLYSIICCCKTKRGRAGRGRERAEGGWEKNEALPKWRKGKFVWPIANFGHVQLVKTIYDSNKNRWTFL